AAPAVRRRARRRVRPGRLPRGRRRDPRGDAHDVRPPGDWEKNRDRYEHLLGERIRVVHGSGAELEPLYDAASACVLFVEPGEYRTFAAPVKFFEYVGHGKPVLLSRGTYAGDLGERLGVGPVIDYSSEALR